jgi:hypothetical protein
VNRALLLLLLAGCGGPPRVVTYRADVAPIIGARCVECHSEGGFAPFALERFDQVASRATAIAAVTRARTMPPWPADTSGSCGTWKDAPSLTDLEIDTLSRWEAGGALEGTGPVKQVPQVEDSLTEPVAVAMSEPYRPNSALADDYRCFVIDPGLSRDRFLTGYQVRPGSPEMVHHVILFSLDDDGAEATAKALESQDARMGYSCFGGSGVARSRILAGWAPGTGATHYPADTGIRLFAGRKLVMQVHYNLSAGSHDDLTAVELELADEVPSEATIVPFANPTLELAPGQTAAESTAEIGFPSPIRVRVYGVFPHMHTLGRSMHVTVDHGGQKRCLTDVPRWSFHWQRFYFLAEPTVFFPQDKISISCSYDTSAQTGWVRWGEGTGDEMCLLGVYATVR